MTFGEKIFIEKQRDIKLKKENCVSSGADSGTIHLIMHGSFHVILLTPIKKIDTVQCTGSEVDIFYVFFLSPIDQCLVRFSFIFL